VKKSTIVKLAVLAIGTLAVTGLALTQRKPSRWVPRRAA
jgi:hypothetical protein